ncbi:MAG: FAD-linked oxidase [Rhodocyclaceae bacterium]|nr:FAD-linked oxidase [Rhodocyclaceae bacterium]
MGQIDQAAWQAFQADLRGEAIVPGDPGYDQARTVWNAMIDRKPAAIVRCRGTADVIQAVNFARQQNLLLAVRGGGHNIAGNAVCTDGLVIDFSAMRSVQVDPQSRRAYVEPGATLADFDHEAQAFGLATPLGINSTTGVSGLTLGGGFGWLTRKHGLSIDNLISAEVVTADGQRIMASRTEHPDLFWALRGGGGNFGVVTRFEFQLHPVGPEVLAGLIVFPFADARRVLEQYRAFVQTMPDELCVWALLRPAPPLPFLPVEVHGQPVAVLAVCHAGDPADGQRLIAPLRSFAKAHGEHLGMMPYRSWQQAFDPLLTAGARNYWKTHNFTQLADGVLDTILQYAGQLPSGQCEIFIGLLGGAAGRIAPDATAYTQRDALFVMNVHARWDSPGQDAACRDWSRNIFRETERYASDGAYVNFLTEDEAARVASAYGSNYVRLAHIKSLYDPGNTFRVNQNIAPSSSSPP